MDDPGLAARLSSVRQRIVAAARRAERDPASVRLVVVTKTVPAGRLAPLPALECLDLGENRVQEALPKIEALSASGFTWHLVGHLQRNKARSVPGRFAWVHSVDSPALAEELSRRAASASLRCLAEVNVSGEPQKHGMAPADLPPFLERASRLGGISIEGLMTVAPLGADEAGLRRVFASLRSLALAHRLRELSMGMSDDFEIAVEEGATMVRIGRAIFGDRE